MSVHLPKYRHHKGSGQALVAINGHRPVAAAIELLPGQ
jgi:hypothetical protein